MKYIILLTILFGCSLPNEEEQANIRASHVRFFYHSEAKLCFAISYDIATVPCTPEVLALCANRP